MFLSLRLEVLLEDIVGGSFLAPVSDDTGGTLDHLPGLALAVNLAQTGPLAQPHVAVNLRRKPVLVKIIQHKQIVSDAIVTMKS